MPDVTKEPVRIALLRGATLRGDVVDARGFPIDGASIEVIGTDTFGLPIAETPLLSAFRNTHFDWSLAGPLALIPAGELGVMPGPSRRSRQQYVAVLCLLLDYVRIAGGIGGTGPGITPSSPAGMSASGPASDQSKCVLRNAESKRCFRDRQAERVRSDDFDARAVDGKTPRVHDVAAKRRAAQERDAHGFLR